MDGPSHAGEERRPRAVNGAPRLLRVSTLDDAREGMDLVHPSAGRPLRSRQRAVAGDRRDPGRQGQLGTVRPARRRRRGAGPRDHRGARRAGRRAASRASTTTRCGSPASTPPSWTRRPSRRLGYEPHQAAAGRRRQPARRPRPGRVPRRVRADRRQRRRSASTSTSTARTPTACLVNLVQGGLGLPDESYYHDEKFAEIREKYVAFLTRMFALVEHADPAGRRRDRDGRRDPAVAGPLGARRDPRRPEDLQPADPRGAARAVPGVRLGGLHPQPRRLRAGRSPRPASGSRPTSSTSRRRSRRCRSRTGAPGWPPASSGPYAPYLTARVRRDQLRLLRPHPQRHARAARALEARRRPGRGLDR